MHLSFYHKTIYKMKTKVLDDARVLNIPNMSYKPIGITLAYHNPTGGH